MTAPHRLSATLAAALLFAAVVHTEANAGGGGGGIPPNPNPSGGPPTGGGPNDSPNSDGPRFSLSQELSFDPSDETLEVEAETEAVAFFAGDDEGDRGAATPTFVAPGDGGASPPPPHPGSASAVAHLQSSALCCSGGGPLVPGAPVPDGRGFVAVAECRFGLAMDVDSDLDDDDDDSDDDTDTDTDDDDGHSSMLSNASLRRSLASANGAGGVRAGPPPDPENSDGRNRGGRPGSGAGSITRTRLRGRRAPTPARGPSRSRRGLGPAAPRSALCVRGGGGGGGGGGAARPTEFAERLAAAALVTVAYEALLGHMLEFVKIVMQTSPPGTSYREVMGIITAEKGIGGVWDGFIPWGVVQAVFKGGVFGLAHAVASSYLLPLVDRGVMPRQLAMTLAGGIGGGFQGYVLSPTLLLKTRVMTNPAFREKMSVLRTTLLSLTIGFDVVIHEGLLTLMKGANIFALKRVLDWATRYFFSDLFEAILLQHSVTGSLTNGEKIAASLLGGTASTISTIPLDVLVAKIQDAKKAGAAVSGLELLRKELEERGWRGVWDATMQGFEARLLHVCFTTVVMKTFSPIVFDFLFGKK